MCRAMAHRLIGVLEDDMRTAFVAIAVGVVMAIGVTPAAAQQRVPDAGMWAVGASAGASGPADASLQRGFEGAGNIEGYMTPRVSIRGQVGATSWDVVGRNFSGTITPIFADANLVYNWEGGVVHPYVTGGVGIYHYHGSESATQDRSDTKPGVDVGGGLEYFFTRHTTITGELLYHKVGAFASPLATFNDGSFWRFGVGAKVYMK